jgi:hypothetical protein
MLCYSTDSKVVGGDVDVIDKAKRQADTSLRVGALPCFSVVLYYVTLCYSTDSEVICGGVDVDAVGKVALPMLCYDVL